MDTITIFEDTLKTRTEFRSYKVLVFKYIFFHEILLIE